MSLDFSVSDSGERQFEFNTFNDDDGPPTSSPAPQLPGSPGFERESRATKTLPPPI